MRQTRTALAISAIALVLGTAACQDGRPEGSGTATQSATPPASISAQPQPTVPPGVRAPGQNDPFADAAARFAMPKATIEQAAVAAKLEMLKLGGSEGEKLPAGILDPAVLDVFAKTLGVPVSQAEPVLRHLVAEWDEYEQGTEATIRDNINKSFARQLNISPRRAEWLRQLLARRPLIAEGQPDPIAEAVARDLGLTLERLFAALDEAKKNSSKNQ